MSLIAMQIRRKIAVWAVLIGTGILAYGLGLYQGSQFRMQRSVASSQKAIPAEIPAPAPEAIKPQPVNSASSPSNNPSNTQSPKSRSGSH